VGNPGHLEFEALSALADGELEPALRPAAMEHLVDCQECTQTFESLAEIDVLLRKPTAIGCEAALTLLSAVLDQEADAAEVAVARAHAAGCASCTRGLVTWSSLEMQLRALPTGSPSARVDHAIAALGREPKRTGLRLGLPRIALASVTALLLLIGSLYRGAPGTAPVATNTNDQVLVAAVQQVVYSSRTNTLYVLDAPAAAVDARDATTNDLKARIEVGGRPTALALNESANTVLVLDATQKKLTEIDASSNKILGSSTVATSGTPTAITVDPTSSKIVVTASDSTTKSNSVSVIDSTTKEVESVRDVEVGAVTMVFDSSGDRAVLVSPTVTTLVDSKYTIITRLPGGVSAAFAQGDDRIAILSASGKNSIVTFAGPRAPLALELPGTPRAITALPDGGFLVLVELGGKSRVSYVAPDGHDYASTDVAGLGSDLVYDVKTKKFSIVGRDGIASADAPAAVLSAAASPSPLATAVPTPSASAAPSSSAQPSASAEPSPTPAPSATTSVLAAASPAGPTFVHVDLPGHRAPILVSKRDETLWVLDDRNGVVKVNMAGGRMDFVTLLPRSAEITYLVAGRKFVYAVDARAGAVHVIDAASGKTTNNAMLFIKPVSSVVVGLDDRLWVGLNDISYLLAFDPVSSRTTAYELGNAHISRLSVDAQGRILYADDARSTVGTYDSTEARLSEIRIPRRGATTGLVVDRDGTLWLSTSAGEIHSVRNKTPRLALGLQRPVTALSLDASGRAWYLAPLASVAAGFGYAAADGAEQVAISGPASTLDFSSGDRAWLADPRGGFYVSKETE
jgi:predicted anti-sigma-YlaC factor YlaD